MLRQNTQVLVGLGGCDHDTGAAAGAGSTLTRMALT
jgi:hypothetical protein